MWFTIVGIRQCVGVEVPILGVVTQVPSYHGLGGPVANLDLPVRLVMVRRDEDFLDVQDVKNVLKELGGEASFVLGFLFLRSSVFEYPLAQDVLGEFCF